MRTETNTQTETETENSDLLETLIEDAIDMGPRGEPTEHLENYQFSIREEEIQTESGIILPKQRAIVREDTGAILGTVGSHYKVLTHSEALDPILDRLKKKNIKTFKRVNLADDGAKMFANVYFPGEETSFGEGSPDTVWPGISIVNSLDGHLKYLGEATLYRLACTNGMRVPTKLAGFSAMHSKNKNFDSMVDQILDFIADGSQFSTFQRLANTGKKLDTIELTIDNILEDKRSTFPKRYKDLVMNEINRGEYSFNTITLWDVYNAFQSVIEHNIIRNKGRMQRGRILEDNLFKYFEKVMV